MDTENTPRDELARQRTHLANERTFLAYVRTSVSFLVLGVALIHFLEGSAPKTLGWLAVVAGVVMPIYGFLRFKKRSP